MIWLS